MKRYYEWYWKCYWKGKGILSDFDYKWPQIKKYIPTEDNITLLDFGCGKGIILKEALKINKNLKITGVDISREALRIARRTIPKAEFFLTSEDTHLPFKNNSFDFILALDVVEHLFNVKSTLKELNRVLKKDGKILISVPFNGLFKNLIIALFFYDKMYDIYGPHLRFFTKKSLLKCLKASGFKTKKIGFYGLFYPIWKGMYFLAEKQ